MNELEKPLVKDCICRGSGQYRIHKQTETVFYLRGPATNEEWQPLPIEVQNMKCSYHREHPGRDIYYPDGWEEEDLLAWCEAQRVPVPEWLTRQRYVPKILWSGTISVHTPKHFGMIYGWTTEPEEKPLKTSAPAELPS